MKLIRQKFLFKFIVLLVCVVLGTGCLRISPKPQPRLPETKEQTYRTITTEVSAYNPLPEQTDDTPFIMASNKRVYEGAIACPRWLEFGTEVEILSKRYTCEDRMNIRYKTNFDIFMWEYQDALNFGRKILEVKIYK